MKLLLFFFLFISYKSISQDFGVSQILVYPSPAESSEINFYNWYQHPDEEEIYVISFERSLDGFKNAFYELHTLLYENNLKFENYFSDQSQFHNSVEKKYTFEELHSSIINKKSKIFRTWNSGTDYLTMLLNHDVYMMILGNKEEVRND